MMVLKHLMGLIAKEVPVYYIPGNHDEMLRKFRDFSMGSLKVANKLSLKLDKQNVWIFHGDVFDVVMQHSRWLAKLGAVGYDTLILINRLANFVSLKMGRGKLSFSKKVKNSVKSAVSFINKFEDTVCSIAAEQGHQYVICGHIHQPQITSRITAHGPVVYMNSGDWVENLTSLEYAGGEWKIYRYTDDEVAQSIDIATGKKEKDNPKAMLAALMRELHM